MSRSEVIRYLILRSIGNFLLLFAIVGVLATFGPALYYEAVFRVMQVRGVSYKVETFAQVAKEQRSKPTMSLGFSDILSGSAEKILTPVDTEFDILIPKIGANARVFPNVDPSDTKQFLPILQNGIAHAKGTVFPGLPGTTYLFAHSTDNFWNVGRYNAAFYLIKDLSFGDEVVVFYKDTRYNYKVVDSRVIDAQDVSYLTQAQGSEEQLILQTCWPPGTTWKRLLVFAKPK